MSAPRNVVMPAPYLLCRRWNRDLTCAEVGCHNGEIGNAFMEPGGHICLSTQRFEFSFPPYRPVMEEGEEMGAGFTKGDEI